MRSNDWLSKDLTYFQNYCTLVWYVCGIRNSWNMERIQDRALRFVYEDYGSPYDILSKRETFICYTNVA